jgi:hypothetical protein
MAPRLEEDIQYGASKDLNENVVGMQHRPNRTHDNQIPIMSELKKDQDDLKLQIVWRNVGIFVFLHFTSLYGVYLCFYSKWHTLIFGK